MMGQKKDRKLTFGGKKSWNSKEKRRLTGLKGLLRGGIHLISLPVRKCERLLYACTRPFAHAGEWAQPPTVPLSRTSGRVGTASTIGGEPAESHLWGCCTGNVRLTTTIERQINAVQ